MIRLWARIRRRRDPLMCREFVELVTDYLQGALPARERNRFELHLSECDGVPTLSGEHATNGELAIPETRAACNAGAPSATYRPCPTCTSPAC